MNESDRRLDRLGRELELALGRHTARHRLWRVAAVTAVVMVFSAAAVASDGVGLHTFGLDPGRFDLLGGERVDKNAEYIYARNKGTGYTDVFIHTQDDVMPRYEAFKLHQRAARAAAAASGTKVEPGPDCSRIELTRAEVVGLETLAASFEPGTMVPDRGNPAAHGPADAAVDEALRAKFADRLCSGLGYAGDIALLVYARLEPISNLMPGARPTAKRLLDT